MQLREVLGEEEGTVGFFEVVGILLRDRCGLGVELGQHFSDQASFNSVSEKSISLDIGNGVVLDVPEELFGDDPREDLLMSLHLLLLLLLEELDVFELTKQLLTFSCSSLS